MRQSLHVASPHASLILSLVGGALGIGIAYQLHPFLPGFVGNILGNTTLQGDMLLPSVDTTPSTGVIVFASAVVLLTGLGFGVVPALAGTRMDLSAMMKPGEGAYWMGRPRFAGPKLLVALQVGLAIPLVAGSGLFVQTVVNLEAVPVGYDPEGLLIATVAPGQGDRSRVVDALGRLEGLPGVQSASMSVWPLFNNAEPRPVCVPARDPLTPETVDLEYAFPRFFETWGVPVLEGREFRVDGESGVAVVNQAFVRAYYPGGSPIGRTVGVRDCPGARHTIVGVVADHIDRQRVDLVPMIYLPYPSGGAMQPTTFALRTTGDPRVLIPTVRDIIRETRFNPDGDVTTGSVYRDRTIRRERFLSRILLFSAGAALVVAAIGIYGMLAYVVASRSGEIGIRMALGASPGHVARTIGGQALAPVVTGAIAGTGAALVLGRLGESLLFGVGTRDFQTLLVAVVVMTATAAVAALLPARRASLVDPLRTLRHE
jgi:predicted permease